MNKTLHTRALRGVVWTVCESFSGAALSLAVFVIMARVLDPQDFGVVTLAGVFVHLSNLAVTSAFTDALVQRNRLDPRQASTAFWATLGLAGALTGLSYMGAGPLARLLDEPLLAEVLPWLTLVVPLTAIGSVQTALCRRDLHFRTVAIRTTAGRTIGAIAGIAMLFGGFGMWSLVGQQLAGALVTGIAMAAGSNWRPKLQFSFQGMRELWGFGFHVSTSHIVSGATEQGVNLLVGSMFGTSALGYFNIAWRTVQLVKSLTSTAVYHVGFSAFARLQSDRAAMTRGVLRATRLSCLFGFPVAAGIAALAAPLVLVVFGERWETSVPLLALLSVELVPAFYAMFFAACFRALGHPGWVTALSALYAVTTLGTIVLLAPLGVWAVAAAWLARSFLLLPIPVVLMQRALGIPMREILNPVAAPALAATIMAAAIAFLVQALGGNVATLWLVVAAVPSGALVYTGAIALLSPDLLRLALGALRTMLSSERRSQVQV